MDFNDIFIFTDNQYENLPIKSPIPVFQLRTSSEADKCPNLLHLRSQVQYLGGKLIFFQIPSSVKSLPDTIPTSFSHIIISSINS